MSGNCVCLFTDEKLTSLDSLMLTKDFPFFPEYTTAPYYNLKRKFMQLSSLWEYFKSFPICKHYFAAITDFSLLLLLEKLKTNFIERGCRGLLFNFVLHAKIFPWALRSLHEISFRGKMIWFLEVIPSLVEPPRPQN